MELSNPNGPNYVAKVATGAKVSPPAAPVPVQVPVPPAVAAARTRKRALKALVTIVPKRRGR